MSDRGPESIKIAIYDDETERAQGWGAEIQRIGAQGFSVQVPSHDDIYTNLDRLYSRRDAITSGAEYSSIDCALDDIDVLVVDYDLRDLKDHRGFATGEEIAYAARLFSRVKVVVVVNHPDIGLNDFDLTLNRDRNLKADVYIGEAQVANPGLWIADAGHDGFLPWAWPVLVDDVHNFDKCFDSVRKNLDQPLTTFFNLSDITEQFSNEMLGFLGISNLNTTLREIIQTGSPTPFVRPKDRDNLLKNDDRLSMTLTIILRKWLRRWVIPSQTILADIPHIASNLPWSLKTYQDASQWTRLTARGLLETTELESLFHPEVLSNIFDCPEWLGRCTFLFQKTRESLELKQDLLKNFKPNNVPGLAFAEDLSRFIPYEESIEYDLNISGQPQVRTVSREGHVCIKTDRYKPHPSVTYVPQSMMV